MISSLYLGNFSNSKVLKIHSIFNIIMNILEFNCKILITNLVYENSQVKNKFY